MGLSPQCVIITIIEIEKTTTKNLNTMWEIYIGADNDIISTDSFDCCRYKNGSDHIGEHRDDEHDLDPTAPIASLSLGQSRDFVFRHESARNKCRIKPSNTDRVVVDLKHGYLCIMNPPTNEHWYHSLPVRKRAIGVRVNFTFRKILV